MLNDGRGRHLFIRQLLPRSPSAHVLKGMDLDRVVVARRGDLSRAVERSMADAQSALVLAQQGGELRPRFFAAEFPQVPDAHEAVQGRCGDEMRVRRVEGEAPDFLLRELEDFCSFGGGARICSSDKAVETGEVEKVRCAGVHFDAGKGFVQGRVGGRVDFGGGGFGEVEQAQGGVVGGCVKVGGVCGGELEGGDCASVEVERGDVWFRAVVFVVVLGFFFLDWLAAGGLRAIEDTEVAEFVAGEDEGFFADGVEA